MSSMTIRGSPTASPRHMRSGKCPLNVGRAPLFIAQALDYENTDQYKLGTSPHD
jgi:hypothetical protein